jgi:hypothetical protein
MRVKEEILKIHAGELTTIRLLFYDGTIHELPIAIVRRYDAPENAAGSILAV